MLLNPSLSVAGLTIVRGCKPCDGALELTGGTQPLAVIALDPAGPGMQAGTEYAVSGSVEGVSGGINFREPGGAGTAWVNGDGGFTLNFVAQASGHELRVHGQTNTTGKVRLTGLAPA